MSGIAAVAFVAVTRDPSELLAVGAVIAGASLAVASVSALVALAIEERSAALAQPRGRAPRRWPALRRGVGLGVILAALALLRAVDGLTVVTGGFVVAGFALAEIVLATRPHARSG